MCVGANARQSLRYKTIQKIFFKKSWRCLDHICWLVHKQLGANDPLSDGADRVFVQMNMREHCILTTGSMADDATVCVVNSPTG